MAKPRASSETKATAYFDFIFGRFKLSRWTIPYFSTTMTFEQADESLRLVNDFPGAENMEWSITELYQRDLDWPRVERKILPYLRSTNQPQFFNSLTVALLPIRVNELAPSFDNDSWTPPDMQERGFEKLVSVGPIACGYWNTWNDIGESGAKLGQIRWNPREVFSVAIDGQHRLAAIKALARQARHDPKLVETQVPVILLVLDEKFGYQAVGSAGMVDVLRNLFIDLNKHAKAVSRSRQILLDDHDPQSLCVRSLVGERLADGNRDLLATEPRLPLTIVDWHGEIARFDEGPYITTILGLDWIVSTVLGSKAIRDFMDYSEIGRQLNAFQKSLGADLSKAISRLDQLRDIKQQPFTYLDENGEGELAEIAEAFRTVWGTAIIHILTEFLPYRELLDERESKGTLTTIFVAWYLLYRRKLDARSEGRAAQEYADLMERLGSNRKHPIGEEHLLEQLDVLNLIKKDNLAFNVVFQRAVFHAFLEFRKIDADDLSEDEDEENYDDDVEDTDDVQEQMSSLSTTSDLGERVSERANQFVQALNELCEKKPKFLHKDCDCGGKQLLWLETIRTSGGPIDFTLGASKRANEILFWAATLYLCRETGDDAFTNFDVFWSAVAEEESDAPMHKRLRMSLRRFCRDDNKSTAARIFKNRQEDYDKEAAWAEARLRLKSLWKVFAN